MAHFNGFHKDDFDTLEGCSWRGRDALGGVLSRALRPQLGADCESWGVARRVEVHIAKRSQYEFKKPIPVAKLFVYTRDEELAYGFYVEATGKRKDDPQYPHWKKFRDRLHTKSSLRDAIDAAIAKHDLIVTDYYRRDGNDAPIGTFESTKGEFQFFPRGSKKGVKSSVNGLADAVAKLSGDEWVNIHIYARIDKNKAIKMGKDVVAPILTVLDTLAPVYMTTIA